MKCIARESLPLLIVVSLVSAAALPCSASDDVTFARDVQPLLARKCFACHGPDDEFREDDLRLEKDGQTVLVDPVSLPFLSGATIDFTEELIGARFAVDNPNATSSCGCGTSFSM